LEGAIGRAELEKNYGVELAPPYPLTFTPMIESFHEKSHNSAIILAAFQKNAKNL